VNNSESSLVSVGCVETTRILLMVPVEMEEVQEVNAIARKMKINSQIFFMAALSFVGHIWKVK
jgi:hypothetical protein